MIELIIFGISYTEFIDLPPFLKINKVRPAPSAFLNMSPIENSRPGTCAWTNSLKIPKHTAAVKTRADIINVVLPGIPSPEPGVDAHSAEAVRRKKYVRREYAGICKRFITSPLLEKPSVSDELGIVELHRMASM